MPRRTRNTNGQFVKTADKPATNPLFLRVPEATLKSLRDMAKALDITVSDLIARLVQQAMTNEPSISMEASPQKSRHSFGGSVSNRSPGTADFRNG